MENIIYNELRSRGFNVDVGVIEIRTSSSRLQTEIDFIASLGPKKYYIQSAYMIPDKDKYLQETRPFDKVDDSFKKIIIVRQSIKPRYDEKGYMTIGIIDFLLNKNSLDL